MKKASILQLIIVIAILISSTNVLFNDYALDDEPNILLNENVKAFAIGDIFTSETRSSVTTSGLYRPLTETAFALCYSIAEQSFFVFHLLSLVLHILVSILVFRFCVKLFQSDDIAFVSAIIFALSPIHSEVIANASSLSELLSAFFSLSALIYYIRFRNTDKKRWLYLTLSVNLFFLALLSKENAFFFVFAFPIYDILIFKLKNFRKVIVCFSAFILPAVIYLIMRINAVDSLFVSEITPFIDNPLVDSSITLSERLVTAFNLFFKYIKLAFIQLNLQYDYSYSSITITDNALSISTFFSILIFAGSLYLIYFFSRRNKTFTYLILMFYTVYFIASNSIIPIGTIFAERLYYFPSVMLYILIGTSLFYLFRKIKIKTVSLYIFTVVISILFGITLFQRNLEWKNNETLYISDIKGGKNSAKIMSNAGYIYRQKQLYDKAISFCNASLQILPNNPNAILQIGLAYSSSGETDLAADKFMKLSQFSYKQNRKYHLDGYYYLAMLETDRKSFEKAKNYFLYFINSGLSHPKYIDAHYQLAVLAKKHLNDEKLFKNIAENKLPSLLENDEIESSEKIFQVYRYLGLLSFENGDYSKAEQYFDEMITHPSSKDYIKAEAYYRKGIVSLIGIKDKLSGKKYFLKALEFNPKHKDALYNLAVFYLKNQELDKSDKYFQKLIEAHPDDVNAFITYVNGLLNTKRFNKAQKVLKQLLNNNPGYHPAAKLLEKLRE